MGLKIESKIDHARKIFPGEDFGVQFDKTGCVLGVTIIDLCRSAFSWVKFSKSKGAVKLHKILDLRRTIPTFVSITEGKVHDVNILDC